MDDKKMDEAKKEEPKQEVKPVEVKKPAEVKPEVKPEAPKVSVQAPKLPIQGENKVVFMVWFTDALTRFDGVKAHHMHSIQSYFKSLGFKSSEAMATFDEGLKKFGYGRKN